MYEISVKAQFSAAHHLTGYSGKCEAFHGHNWDVEVFVAGGKLDETGILLDFRELRKAVKAELETLDHTDLNQHPAFVSANPTSEHLARHIYRRVGALVNTERCRVSKVIVHETPGAKAIYSEP